MSDLQKFIDELREKIPIAEVVGERVKLVRKGREWTGLCPFHNEKTPSFTVNETKGFYHCFGCGAHGDILKFEMEANNLPFIDALQKLAAKAGLQVPSLKPENQAEVEKRKSLYDIMELAVTFYEKNLYLTAGKDALAYLYNRGFDDELIKKFRLGYAPNNNGLKALLSSKDVSDEEMQDLGLITTPEDITKKKYDFFRDRVIIPIFNKKGMPIAFGGRILGDGQPKYLNSPETPIFNKRRILYNMHNARDFAFKEKALIVCEGYMDVIALDKFGFHNAVAPLGTALTEEQILDAWKVCPEPVLCFDGDNAGIRAAMRSSDRALSILEPGYSLQYAFLPDKLDPDDFLKLKGRTAFQEILSQSQPLLNILWQKNVEAIDANTPEKKALLEKNVLEDVKKIQDETVRSYYWQEIKNIIYNKLGRGQYNKKKSPQITTTNNLQIDLDEHLLKSILSLIIFCPDLINKWEEKLASFRIKNQRLKELLDTCLQAHNNNENIAKIIEEKGFGVLVKSFWELDMLKEQKRQSHILEQELEIRLIEIQIKQLDLEIKECLRIIELSKDFPEDIYVRYEICKKEREALLGGILN